MAIRIVQTSKQRPSEDLWDWEVHLEGANDELDQIKYVEYTLHETFSNPLRREYDRASGFALKELGWGTFTLYFRINYKDVKRKDDYRELNLSFDKPAMVEVA